MRCYIVVSNTTAEQLTRFTGVHRIEEIEVGKRLHFLFDGSQEEFLAVKDSFDIVSMLRVKDRPIGIVDPPIFADKSAHRAKWYMTHMGLSPRTAALLHTESITPSQIPDLTVGSLRRLGPKTLAEVQQGLQHWLDSQKGD